MTEHQTSRTLVKSAPELWAECSDAASLTRHLGAFGEIRITKLEPETAVAWEGTAASGTVRLEPAGWGTRVTLTVTAEEEVEAVAQESQATDEPAAMEEPVATEEPEPVEEPELVDEPEVLAEDAPPDEPATEAITEAPRTGLFLRFRRFFAKPPAAETVEPVAEAPPQEPIAEIAEPPEPPAPVAEMPEPPEPPEPVAEMPEPPEPVADVPEPADDAPEPEAEQALAAALDSLGRAHHRPYSRA